MAGVIAKCNSINLISDYIEFLISMKSEEKGRIIMRVGKKRFLIRF